ncbi:MAG: LiaI-LiaF-like domain-containing protein [Rhodothermaceae bacterium]
METNKSNGRSILGILLVVIGLIFFGDNLDLFNFDLSYYIFRWQSILIIIGVIMLLNSVRNTAAYILIIIGVGSYVANYYHYSLWEIVDDYWPVLLIAFGLYIIAKRGDSPAKKCSHRMNNKSDFHSDSSFSKCENMSHSEINDDTIDLTAIFSGKRVSIKSDSFSGGKTTTVFGGVELDLRDAKLAPGNNIIDSFTLFGGTEILVPKEWKISVNVVVLFGGVDDKRNEKVENIENPNSTLVLKGLTLFGGTEIRYV